VCVRMCLLARGGWEWGCLWFRPVLLVINRPPRQAHHTTRRKQTQEGEARIQGLVLPYYTSIVKSGISAIRGEGSSSIEGGAALDGPKLVQWRQSLGVSEAQATRLHAGEFAKEVARCVQAGGGRVRDGDAEVLAKIRALMGISSLEAERALESVTAPLLRESIVEMLTSLTATDAAAWPDALHRVRQRQKELKMVDSALVFHIKVRVDSFIHLWAGVGSSIWGENGHQPSSLTGTTNDHQDVYRERLKGLIRQAAEASLPLEAGAEGAEKEALEGKLRKTVGAAMLLMRLMRQFLEVRERGSLTIHDVCVFVVVCLVSRCQRHGCMGAQARLPSRQASSLTHSHSATDPCVGEQPGGGDG
jgi:hypothetical protein